MTIFDVVLATMQRHEARGDRATAYEISQAVEQFLGTEYGRISKTQWAAGISNATVLSDTPGNVDYQRDLGYVIVKRIKAGDWAEA